MKNFLTYFLLCFAVLPYTRCSHPQVGTCHAAFEYREIYLPERFFSEMEYLWLDNVDMDWGLWGHNLSRVLPEHPSRTVFATIDGRAVEEQFCFSSDLLYKYIVSYIEDNFGEQKPERFAILPNDNELVCQCERCVEKGCKKSDASPAVQYMLERLAGRFPKHLFFTSYYMTTRSVPLQPLKENIGVLISAIDFDLCAKATPKEDEFRQLLAKWSTVTKHVYVWDYINNFDDYITPFPIFTIMQRRFLLYKEAGVSGIFLNGSGNDNSSFSRLKLHILAAMLEDPAIDWRALLKEKCQELYPVTGDCIMQYILSQEEMVEANGKTLPLYQGVAVARQVYLDEEKFIRFHEQLMELYPNAFGEERQEMRLLSNALMLTRLEIKRLHGDTTDCTRLLDKLQEATDAGLRIYSESFWTLDNYIRDYRDMLAEAKADRPKDRLLGVPLTALTPLDQDYNDISILTDGFVGLPSNYHCGHLISSADPALKIAIPSNIPLRRLHVELMHNIQFHIALPLSVRLTAGNKEIGIVRPQQTDIDGRYIAEFDVPKSTTGTLILTIERNKEQRTMAIDEIVGW